MSLPASVKLEALSVKLRDEMLFTSGGWLGELVPLVSDALGIWDTFVLGVLFIFAWVVLRVSDPLTSLILGLTFDVTIPLQHQLNPKLVDKHQAHLQGYWPIQAFAAGLEMLCFFMVIPELFTMIVCLKTFIMTSIWLGRRTDGSFLTERNGQRGRSRSKLADDPPSERPSERPSSEKPSKRSPSATPPSPSEPDPKPAKSKDKEKGKDESSTNKSKSKDKKDKWTAAQEKELRKKLKDMAPPVEPPPHDPGPGFAPAGRGPPISKEDAARDAREREARRKARGLGVKPEVAQFQRAPSAKAALQGLRGPAFGIPGNAVTLEDVQGLFSIADKDYRSIYLNPKDPEWQFEIWRIRKSNGNQLPVLPQTITAVWEKALPHDSVDLLNWYLKKLGIEKELRGWMILDLMSDIVQSSVAKTFKDWQDAYYARDATKILTENHARLSRRSEIGWRPFNDCWGTIKLDPRGTRVGAGEMDEFIWQMREAEVSPDARVAMLRDLMSQPSQEAYDSLKEELIGYTKLPHPNAVSKGPLLDEIVAQYQKMQQFGGRHHVSTDALHNECEAQKKMNKFSLSQINDHLRIIRWCVVRDLPRNPWEHERYLDEIGYWMQSFGANLEIVFGKKKEDILAHWRTETLKAGR